MSPSGRGVAQRQSNARNRPLIDAKRTLNDGHSGPIVRHVERTFPPAPRRPPRFPTERAMDVVNVAWGLAKTEPKENVIVPAPGRTAVKT